MAAPALVNLPKLVEKPLGFETLRSVGRLCLKNGLSICVCLSVCLSYSIGHCQEKEKTQ